MCKLCNTTNQPTTVVTDHPRRILFYNTVLDYLGELPCEPCCRTVINKWDRTIKTDDNLDKYIISKLFRNYYTKYKSKRQDYRRTNCIATIQCRINPYSGLVVYHVRVVTSLKTIQLGSYNTLKEALEVKIKYCIENNITKALKIMQIKLKELENEQNIT